MVAMISSYFIFNFLIFFFNFSFSFSDISAIPWNAAKVCQPANPTYQKPDFVKSLANDMCGQWNILFMNPFPLFDTPPVTKIFLLYIFNMFGALGRIKILFIIIYFLSSWKENLVVLCIDCLPYLRISTKLLEIHNIFWNICGISESLKEIVNKQSFLWRFRVPRVVPK